MTHCHAEVVIVVGGVVSRFAQRLSIPILRAVTQPWLTPFVEAMYRLVPGTAVELVVRRYCRNGRVQVLLFKRAYSQHDPWDQMHHCPGVMVRGADGRRAKELSAGSAERVWSHQVALGRLIDCEIGLPVRYITLVGRDEVSDFGPRVLVWQIVYVGTLPEDTPAPEGAQWFYADELPEEIIPEHIPMIRNALAGAMQH